MKPGENLVTVTEIIYTIFQKKELLNTMKNQLDLIAKSYDRSIREHGNTISPIMTTCRITLQITLIIPNT